MNKDVKWTFVLVLIVVAMIAGIVTLNNDKGDSNTNNVVKDPHSQDAFGLDLKDQWFNMPDSTAGKMFRCHDFRPSTSNDYATSVWCYEVIKS